MSVKRKLLLFLGAAALAVPAAASAQQYYRQPQYGQPSYGQPRGDWYRGRRVRFGSYPEFRPLEAHIRSEIQDGIRDDLLMADDARDLMGQLRQIQSEEYREYRVHGWNLPEDDRARIRSELDQLDQTVDQTRNEPE